MMRITILAVGKIKKDYFREAIGEYLKRLSPYAKIDVEEIEAEPFKRESDKDKAKKIEGEKILKFLEKNEGNIIILDEKGKNFSSHEFAEFLEDKNERIIFVIGGALGFHENILENPYRKLSLSKMTFPHEMARMILLEQIYRASAIMSGKEYHY